MNVLVVGGGGREHTIALALSKSPRVNQVFVAPGNGGTDGARGVSSVDIAATDIPALVTFAREQHIGLTFVGPEAPLACGIVDVFTA